MYACWPRPHFCNTLCCGWKRFRRAVLRSAADPILGTISAPARSLPRTEPDLISVVGGLRLQEQNRFGQEPWIVSRDAFSSCGFRPEAFLPVYGLAEATLMVSGGPRGKLPTVLQVDAGALAEHRICEVDDGRTSGRHLVASGTCLPSQHVVIVDPETRRPRSRDEVGEIWVQGGSIAQGYFRQSEVTNRTFQAFLADSGEGPFLRTGDLGFIRGGQLFVTGRLKDLIIIRGRNYYPEDIELIVEALHPGFRAGHCVAFPVEVKDQERLVVVQELEPRTRTLEWDTTFQAVRQAISAAHEVDAYSIVLAKAGAIPKTTSGKRRRALCRDLFLRDELEVHARWTAPLMNGHHHPLVPAQNDAVPQPTAKEIEVWLVQRIAGQLGVPTANIHVNTPFLELGMDSLAAMEVAGDLQKWLNRRLSPTAVYNYPSIASLAAWLANSTHAVKSPASDPDGPFGCQQLRLGATPERCPEVERSGDDGVHHARDGAAEPAAMRHGHRHSNRPSRRKANAAFSLVRFGRAAPLVPTAGDMPLGDP